MTVIAACSNGRDDVYNPLPPIEIGDMTKAGLPTQIAFGETLRLTPAITYGSEGAEAFDFHWYRRDGNQLTLLSTDRNLSQKMDSLGMWNCYLEVTNKQTKVSKMTSFSIMVLSRTQRGWYVLKENDEGNTDLDFYQVTDKGQDSSSISNMLKEENITFRGKPVGLYYVNSYSWQGPGATNPGNYMALLPMSEQDMGALRIETGTLMESTDKMFFDNADKVSHLSGGLSNYDQAMLVNNGRVYLMPSGMQAFLPEVIGDYRLSPWLTISNVPSTATLGFDEKNGSFVSINKMTSTLNTFPQKYLRKKISSNHMNGTISFMENMNGNLNPDTTYTQRAYALFKENNRTDRCILLGLDLAQLDASQSKSGNFQYSPIMEADTISYDRVPALRNASILALHKTAPNLYIANGNTISRYDVENHTFKADVKTFAKDETVTYMHYIVNQYDMYNGSGLVFEDLVVATSKPDGTYRIYRFKVAGDNFIQEGSIFSGEGKVKTLLYVSPYNTMINYIYRYY